MITHTEQTLTSLHRARIKTRTRYDRIAWLYDLIEAPSEWLVMRKWRRELFAEVPAGRLLEVGVGTGKNLAYYPPHVEATAIDLSDKMLAKARRKPHIIGLDLRPMDVQQLGFPNDSFDTIVATFVFCSVPDPIAGLREIRRVLKPSGKLLLLEHVRPENRFLGLLFDLLNPFVVRMMGANVNRRTIENVEHAGLKITDIEKLSTLFRRIVAQVEGTPP